MSSGLTAWEAQAELEIPVESVIPTRRGEQIGGEEISEEGETIRLVPVVTGG